MLFCSLSLVQSEGQTPETERTNETCFPVCDLVKELSALREKVGVMETKLKESENQIHELKTRGNLFSFQGHVWIKKQKKQQKRET